MNNLGIAMTCLGESFYATMISRGVADEQYGAAGINGSNTEKRKMNSVNKFGDVVQRFIRSFCQIGVLMHTTNMLVDHFVTMNAPANAIKVARLFARYGNLLILIPLGVSFRDVFGESGLPKNVTQIVLNIGMYISRGIEVGYAGLLVSRIVQNDSRLSAAVALAVLVVGVAYRSNVSNRSKPVVEHNLIDRVYTQKRTLTPYFLSIAALFTSRVFPVVWLILSQGVRDLFLFAGSAHLKHVTK